jgi:hypothetical protein
MRRTLRSLLLTAGLVVASVSFGACKQSEGERCEVDTDCSAGLRCSNSNLTGGFCTANPTGTVTLDAAADLRVLETGTSADSTGTDLAATSDVPAAEAAAASDGAPADVSVEVGGDVSSDTAAVSRDGASD